MSGPENEPAFALEIDKEDVAFINSYVNSGLGVLFQLPQVVEHFVKKRIDRLKPGDIKGLHDHDASVAENAVKYNIEGIKGKWALSRPLTLINALMSCDWISTQRRNLEVLTVGPRTEAEWFFLMGAGFDEKKIRGLDLVSYSPFVKLGDMHDMPFDDNSFDVIMLGWVLAYSNDNEKAVKEVLRVARPGAYVAIGCEYSPLSKDEIEKDLVEKVGTGIGNTTRFSSTKDIHRLFEGHFDRIVFDDDLPPGGMDRPYGMKTILRLKG